MGEREEEDIKAARDNEWGGTGEEGKPERKLIQIL